MSQRCEEFISDSNSDSLLVRPFSKVLVSSWVHGQKCACVKDDFVHRLHDCCSIYIQISSKKSNSSSRWFLGFFPLDVGTRWVTKNFFWWCKLQFWCRPSTNLWQQCIFTIFKTLNFPKMKSLLYFLGRISHFYFLFNDFNSLVLLLCQWLLCSNLWTRPRELQMYSYLNPLNGPHITISGGRATK